MGLEGMTEGVRAGVARRTGHFANTVSRIAEQLPGLGEPDFFQEMVEGHAGGLTEQGGEIGGVHVHGRGQVVQADRAEVMLLHVVQHRVHDLLGVASQKRLDGGFREVGQPLAQFPAQARSLDSSVVQPPQGIVQSAPGHPCPGGGFQIVEDQTRQRRRVIEGGGRNGFRATGTGVSPVADPVG